MGIILFFLPGILLNYIIFPKADIIKRTVYSIVLAVSISTVLGVFLYPLNLLTSKNTILSLTFLTLLFLLILILNSKKKQYKTNFNKDVWYLVLFSLIGTAWRLRFVKSAKNFGDAYGYAEKFIGEIVPDLGFYTGMALDHSGYIGFKVAGHILDFLSVNNQFLSIFLITFVFLGFIYLVFCEYRNKELAYIGVALMALGPVEIFHSTLSIIGHPISYISLFCLFLFFKTKDKNIFWIALLLAVAMMFTYYTASMTMLLASGGFIIALFLKDLIKTKSLSESLRSALRNKKIYAFLSIIIILICYIYIFSNMTMYTFARAQDFSDLKASFSRIRIPTIYKDSTFLGLSAICWQMAFFSLCGLTFIFHITREGGFSKSNIDLLLCLIPILIVSCGFIHVNLPTRIFDYFAFFGLLAIKIPKRYLKVFSIASFIFILITGFYVAKDKKIFFETSNREIEAALWINNSLNEKVFSDQSFVNQLILNDYYNVTGADDKDAKVYNLFYQNSPSTFLNAINALKAKLDVDYIALTKRMREKYILMLNFPQKPLININLYEENLNKVYDNGDVRIYKIEK